MSTQSSSPKQSTHTPARQRTWRGGVEGRPLAGSTPCSAPRPSSAPGSSDMGTMPRCKRRGATIQQQRRGRISAAAAVWCDRAVTALAGSNRAGGLAAYHLLPSRLLFHEEPLAWLSEQALNLLRAAYRSPRLQITIPAHTHAAVCLPPPPTHTLLCSQRPYLRQAGLHPVQRHPALVLGTEQVAGSVVTLRGGGRRGRPRWEGQALVGGTGLGGNPREPSGAPQQEPSRPCAFALAGIALSRHAREAHVAEGQEQARAAPCSASCGSRGCRNRGSSSAGRGRRRAPPAPTQSLAGRSACPATAVPGLRVGAGSPGRGSGYPSASGFKSQTQQQVPRPSSRMHQAAQRGIVIMEHEKHEKSGASGGRC